MTEPTVNGTDNVADDPASLYGEPFDRAGDEAEALSTRSQTQRRLTQARSMVSDATIRARRSATLPTRRKTETTDEVEPSAMSTLVDRLQDYRLYILGAAAALAALIAVTRKRPKAPQAQDGVDLGNWHLRADPPDEEEEE